MEGADQGHIVINVASHGADSCSMAKRLNAMYTDLSSKLPPSSNNEPDLIILEFAVNDYEGQDHITQIRHQASVFFDGFLDITL
jgi:DNA-binding response OmpR family regulator